MKQIFTASLLGLASVSTVFAAEDLTLNEIVVTANRTPLPRESVIADVSVIGQETIERSGQFTLVDILQQQAGIEMTSNGGFGKPSGIFIRGANADQVVILVDGMRINSATSGTTALENLPVDLIDRIEILRGPAASIYGQDAIGGVIQIFTKKGSGKPTFYGSVGYGTYATRKANAGANGHLGDTRYAIGISMLDTNGFSAYDTNNPNLNDDDGYRNHALTGSLSHEIVKGHEIGTQFLYSRGSTRFDNRFNDFAFDPAFSDHAKLEQYSYSFFSKNQILDKWLSTLKIGQGYDKYINYAAPSAFVPVSRSDFATRQRQLSWQHDISLPVGTLTAIYDRLEEQVESTTQYNRTKRDNDGYYLGYFAEFGQHSFQANYRADDNSFAGTNYNRGLAYGFRFNDAWRASVNYGTAFKVPSFNFLYFPFSSNPNLRPEKSKNIEASLGYEHGNTQGKITLYRNKVSDLIISDASTGFTPFNVNKATLEGVTVSLNQQLDHWDFGASVDIQSPRDNESGHLLARRSNRHAKGSVAYHWGDFRIGAELIAASKRYNDAENQQPLAGYTIFNLTSEYKISDAWKLQARLNNVFDKDYALAYDGNPSVGGYVYNTPGSNLFVNVRWQSQ